MKCELCGTQAAAIKKTTKSFGRGDNLVVIEDIPKVHCASCHESYLTADTARELDRIRKNRRRLGKAKRVLLKGKQSKAMADQLTTVSRTRLINRVGSLSGGDSDICLRHRY